MMHPLVGIFQLQRADSIHGRLDCH